MQDRQTTTRGFAVLSAAGIISRILALVYIPIQTHILGNYGNGIVGAGYQIYIFVYYLSNAGIPVALSKLVSEQNTLGNYKNSQRIFKTAGMVLLVLGFAASVFMALGARWIAAAIPQPEAFLTILALSPTLLFTSISSAFRGFFQGRSNMRPTAVSQILEQILNSVLTIVFAAILIRYGTEWGAAGTTVGTSLGALGAAAYLLSVYMKNRKKLYKESLSQGSDEKLLHKLEILKMLALYSIPAVLSVVATYAYGLIDLKIGKGRLLAGGIEDRLATEMYGIFTTQYQRLLNIPLTLTAALPAALIPAISMAIASSDRDMLKRKIREGVKLIFTILLPAAVGLSILAKPIITLIFFSTKLNQGSDLLSFGSWTIIIMAVISIESAVLIGMGKPYIAPVNMSVSLIVKILLNYFLISIPGVNMKGAIIGTFLGYLLAAVLNYRMIRKHLRLKIKIRSLAIKPLTASIIMAALLFLLKAFMGLIFGSLMTTSLIINDLCTLFLITAGTVLYAVLLLKFKAVNTNDILKLPAGNRISSLLSKLRLI